MPEPIDGPIYIRSRDDLLKPFHEAHKPRATWLVGTEAERFGVYGNEYTPLRFFDDDGLVPQVSEILQALQTRFGYQAKREYEEGPPIGASTPPPAGKRFETPVTLEPGSQLELSAPPHDSLFETAEAFISHYHIICEITTPLNVRWLASGFHPVAKNNDLDWLPKQRYRVMREYFLGTGARGHDMMRRTATVQANLDFENEADAMRKLRVSLKLAPIVSAMFANSPFVEGTITNLESNRCQVWLDVDQTRSGLLPQVWHQDSTYEDYVAAALDVPMFTVQRGSRVIANTGQSFAQFMTDGVDGERATMEDWIAHLSTLFFDARLKNIVEVRSADSQLPELICALPAFWKGLLYDEEALAAAEAISADFEFSEVDKLRTIIPEHGLRAPFHEKTVLDYALQLVEAARGGLARQAVGRRDETVFLDPLSGLLEHGLSPSAVAVERAKKAGNLKEGIIAATVVDDEAIAALITLAGSNAASNCG